MTVKTNARIAGTFFLIYIALGITSILLSGQIMTGNETTAVKLSRIVEHHGLWQLDALFNFLMAFCALVIAVCMFALTRHVDKELARMAMICRVTEGIIAITAIFRSMALLSIASSKASVPESNFIAELLLQMDTTYFSLCANCFALGSTIYCYLLLRGHSIPRVLAWFGLAASVLLLIYLPLNLVGLTSMSTMIWMPMLVFELCFALWLIIRGIALPAVEVRR